MEEGKGMVFSGKDNFNDHNNLKNDFYALIQKVVQHKQLLVILKKNGELKESIVDILKDAYRFKKLLVEHDKDSINLGEVKDNSEKIRQMDVKIVKLNAWVTKIIVTSSAIVTVIVLLYEMGFLKVK